MTHERQQENQGIVDHIAFATVDTNKSRAIFSILGFNQLIVDKGRIEKFGAAITKLQSPHGQVLELVEPYAVNNVVNKILQNRQAAMYHSAYFTPDLKQTLRHLTAAGAVIVTEPMMIPYPASSAHNDYHTSHVFHPYVGLFEVTGFL